MTLSTSAVDHDPLLVSGVVGLSSRSSLNTETSQVLIDYQNYFSMHLEPLELVSLGEIDKNNKGIATSLYKAINLGRTEHVHLMPWVKKILNEYGSIQNSSLEPDIQREYVSQYKNLAVELLTLLGDLGNNKTDKVIIEKSKKFVVRSLGAFHRAFAELIALSGDQEPLLTLRNDELYQEAFLVDSPIQIIHDEGQYPAADKAHDIIAISEVIHGLFLQAESGVSPQDLELELLCYYSNFKFDTTTTNNYTEHDALLAVGLQELTKLYKEHPIPPDSSICIAGCGKSPIELKIFSELVKNGVIPNDCTIDMFDMQSATQLGVNYSNEEDNDLTKFASQQGLTVRFYPNVKLSIWADQNAGKYHTVTLIGSVINNDPNQLHWLEDFTSLKKLLIPGNDSCLLVDTANLESFSERNPHYLAWQEYRKTHNNAPPGSRRSAHMDAYAQIFPAYYFRALNSLLGFKHSPPIVWDAGGKHRSLWIERNTSQQISPFANLILKTMTGAYSKNETRLSL